MTVQTPAPINQNQRVISTLTTIAALAEQHELPVPNYFSMHGSMLTMTLDREQRDGLKKWSDLLGFVASPDQRGDGYTTASVGLAPAASWLMWTTVDLDSWCDDRENKDLGVGSPEETRARRVQALNVIARTAAARGLLMPKVIHFYDRPQYHTSEVRLLLPDNQVGEVGQWAAPFALTPDEPRKVPGCGFVVQSASTTRVGFADWDKFQVRTFVKSAARRAGGAQ